MVRMRCKATFRSILLLRVCGNIVMERVVIDGFFKKLVVGLMVFIKIVVLKPHSPPPKLARQRLDQASKCIVYHRLGEMLGSSSFIRYDPLN